MRSGRVLTLLALAAGLVLLAATAPVRARDCGAVSACPPSTLECGFDLSDEANDRCVIIPVDDDCDDNDPCTNDFCEAGSCAIASTGVDTDGDGLCDLVDDDDVEGLGHFAQDIADVSLVALGPKLVNAPLFGDLFVRLPG